MNKFSRTLSVLPAILAMVAGPVAVTWAVPITNKWTLDTPAQYVVSNTNDIEVAAGMARLKLYATSYYQDRIADYLGTNGAMRGEIVISPGIVLSLTTNGTKYFAPGSMISRVLDGGLGNVWEKIYSRASGRLFDNSSGELSPSESGLVALYHMNNDSWKDYVSNINGTPAGGISFITSAKLGSHAGYFNSYRYFTTVNSSLLNGQTYATFTCWINMYGLRARAGVVLTKTPIVFGLTMGAGGDPGDHVAFWRNNSSAFVAPTVLGLSTWYFIVGTYDGITGNMRIYINGLKDAEATLASGAISQSAAFKVGVDEYDLVNRAFFGAIDEVAIYNRILTPDEIYRLYLRPSGLKMQVRSGGSTTLSGDFCGPDGTTNSYYYLDNDPLISGGNFSRFDRYVQYRVIFESDSGNNVTPYLDTMAVYGTKNVPFDSTLGDYLSAPSKTNITVVPAASDTSYVGLRKRSNGGYAAAGIYSSRTFDNGGLVWNSLAWPSSGELTYQEPNLVGLWNMENNWQDDKGAHDGSPTNATFTQAAKLGSYAGIFDGTANVGLGALGNIKAVEFWIKDANFNDSIIDLDGANLCIVVSNGVITAVGVSPSLVNIFVNGKSTSARLLPGWNHVVINYENSVNASGVTVGLAQGDYMEGYLDCLAIYSTLLSGSVVKKHFVMGRQWVAGNIKMQVRSGNTLPLSGQFRGPGGPATFFTASGGSSLLGAVPAGNRYFQYRAYLTGDGTATPALDEVYITYGGTQRFTNDVRAAFDLGTYDVETVWIGDEMRLPNLSHTLPASIDGADASVLALWHLDELQWNGIPNEVIDSSAYGNHGRATGNAGTSPGGNVGTRCGTFDGSGDYVNTRILSLGANDFALCAWVRTSATNRSGIISCYDSPADARYYTLEFNGDGTAIAPGRASFIISHGVAGQRKVVTALRGGLSDNHWHQIVGMRQGSYIYIYIDGERQGTTYIGTYGSVHNPSAPPVIGRYGSDTTKDFSGMIDEVAVFTRALSEGEIGDAYAGGFRTRMAGTFEGDVLDAGRAALWGTLAWNADAPYGMPLNGVTNASELSSQEVGLIALWHLNTDWNDSVGSRNAIPGGGAALVGGGLQKAGAGCASFAPNALATVGACGTINTIEFWVDDSSVNDGILNLNAASSVTIAGGLISVVGVADAKVWINGWVGTRLGRGWNHVAIKTSIGVDANDFKLGVAGGDYMSGRLDEVAIYSIELSEGAIRQHYLDQLGRVGLAGLWHLDEDSGNAIDSSGNNNHGTVSGATYAEEGKFDKAFGFRAAADQVSVPDSGDLLDPAFFTFEGWFYPDVAENQIVGDKRSGGAGFALGTDASGKAFFEVDGVVCSDTLPMRANQWHHLVGVYDGEMLTLYVDGELRATTAYTGLLTDTAVALRLGRAQSGGAELTGLLDEVALFARALDTEEVLDHYRAGACFLKFQARSSASTPIPGGVPYVGPDGTTNTYFTVQRGSDLLSVIPSARYFQYKAYLGTENYRFTPRLQGVRVDVSSYPTDGPYVYPADGFGYGFLGDLLNYADTLATNNAGSVVYQVSGNNGTNWYYWDGSSWADVNGNGFSLANAWNVVNDHIGTFYKQLYDKIGGTFKFKAFLISAGNNMASLDEVRLGYSAGRLTMIQPNGIEVGDLAWLRGYPYTILWSSAGVVSPNNLVIEYSSNSTNGPWNVIASNVVNSGSYSFWTTPNIQNDRMRVRIRDASDQTILDMSDNDFSLTWRFNITAPNGGEKWYIGYTNNITWQSASALGLVRIDFSGDSSGSNFFYNITNGMNNNASSTNVMPWITPRSETLLSQTAKIRIQTLAGLGTDISDSYFTMAGIKIVNPIGTSAFKSQAPANIRWVSAGAGPTVTIQFSADAGTNWTTIAPGTANVPGTNTFVWFVSVLPTETARIKITSDSDPNARDVSEVFTVANIEILAPSGGADWQSGRTNSIVWAAGGAGDWVRIYYSTNAGIAWQELTDPLDSTPYPNISGSNKYDWVIPNYPGAATQVKVESVIDPLNLFGVSSNFNIAGVRVVGPGFGDVWEIDIQSLIRWVHQSAGGTCTLEFSYDGGVTWINVVGPGLGLTDLSYPFTPRTPTVRGMARITADNPFPFTDMRDATPYMTVAGIKVNNPTNGSVYTIGTTNKIEWTSAGSQDPLGQATLAYTSTGSDTNQISVVGNNQAFPGNNTFNWFLAQGVVPSENARVIVKSGAYSGMSEPFVLRGIKLTGPAAGDVLDIGGASAIVWKYAGLAADASANFYLSTDGGVTFSPTPVNPLPYPLNGFAYPWTVAADTMPSTNAVIRMAVVSSSLTNDIGVSALSDPFVIRGVKVVVPTATNVWALRATHQIVWRAANAGSYANVQYSSDGVTYDSARPITNNYVITNVANAYDWQIESFRAPSTNARIKVTVGSRTGISDPFRMEGIKVLAPVKADIWAVDETNRISWKGVGTSGSYTVRYIKDGSITNIIVSGWGTSFYDWVVPAEAVSTNDVILVTDDAGPYYGQSDPFKVVGEPTIEIASPAAGDLWKVSQTYDIAWIKGGRMDNDFLVRYSTDPFTQTNDLFSGPATYDPVANTYSIPWSVPDRLGRTRITVKNNVKPAITNESGEFRVVGMFTVLSPNGGETNIFARRPTTVSWYTRGSVSAVDLFYSTDPLHPESSWVPIATVPNNGSSTGDVLTTYDWTVADVETATARFRVQQSGQPGAYDDSGADFAIRYYEIFWYVYDSVTGTNLDKLSVSDSIGWSQSRLTSPVLHKYPYGFFDTVWSREFFFDSVYFNWKSEPSRTIYVPMNRSQIDPEYRVMADFLYDSATNEFRIHAWLERGGHIFTDPQSCVIKVYDKNGTCVATLPSSTPDANGVFWLVWDVPVSLPRGEIYFAKVDIVFSDVTYSSGLTFNLRVLTEAEQVQRVLNLASNIYTSVTNASTNLDILAEAQSVFRGDVRAALGNISNMTAAISNMTADIGTNVGTILTSLTDFSNMALTRLDTLTGTVGVIGGAEPTLLERVASIQSNVVSRGAQILTRPTSVKLGSSVTVFYRTRTGLSPNLNVFNAAGVPPALLGPLPMSEEATTGIYGRDVPFVSPTFAPGEYTVVCSDPSGSDKLIIQVTAINIDDLAGLATLSNQISQVETRLDAMMIMVTNIDSTIGNLGTLTNLSSAVDMLTSINWAVLSNISAMATDLQTIRASVTNIEIVMGNLGTLTNLSDTIAILTNINWGALSNISTMATDLQEIRTSVSNIGTVIGNLGVLTNLSDTVAVLTNISWSTLSNISAMAVDLQTIRTHTDMINWSNILTLMSSVSNLQGALTNLSLGTNAIQQLAGVAISNLTLSSVVMSNLNYAMTTNMYSMISNLNISAADIRGVGMTASTSTIAMISNLYLAAAEIKDVNLSLLTNAVTTISNVNMSIITNIAATVSNLQVRAVTNMAVIISNLMLTSVGDMKTQLDQVTNNLQSISNALAIIGVDANAASKKARSASTAAATAQTAIQDVQAQLKEGNLGDMLIHLRVMRKAIEEAQDNLKQISTAVGTADMGKSLQEVLVKINEIAGAQGVTNLVDAKTGIGTTLDPQAVAQLNLRLAEARKMLEALTLLMDKSVNKPIVVDWLGTSSP